jgi:hypothetical protein
MSQLTLSLLYVAWHKGCGQYTHNVGNCPRTAACGTGCPPALGNMLPLLVIAGDQHVL